MQSPNSATGRGPGDGRDAPLDEFEAIGRLRERFEGVARRHTPGGRIPPAGEIWIGDDAAVLGVPEGARAVVSTDLVVAGVHVDLELCAPEDIGYKALMVAASDLAAMGVECRYALVSVAGPAGTELERLGAGLAEAADQADCAIVGGDLSAAPVLVISTTVIGAAGTDGPPPLRRSGAAAGHKLFVTGPLGRSAAGLRSLRAPEADRVPDHADLVRAYRRPVARLAAGAAARRGGASAAIDLSDGLAADAVHMAEASGIGLALEAVPVATGATTDEALAGGEDYELLLASGEPSQLVAAFRDAGLPAPLPVGRCTDRGGRYTVDGAPLTDSGWQHRF